MAAPDDGRTLSPLQAVLRFWYLTLLLVVACTAGALLYAADQPDKVTAEARLAVGSSDLAAYQVPGFAQAATQLTANYARFLGSQRSAEQRRAFVGDLADQVDDIRASPIPESNILRIEVVSTSESAATQAAGRVAERLSELTTVDDGRGTAEELLAEYTALSRQAAISEADQKQAEGQLSQAIGSEATPEQLAAARRALSAAQARLSIADLRQQAVGAQYQQRILEPPSQNRLVVVEQAAISTTDRRSRLTFYGVLGAALGALLALLVCTVLASRRTARSEPPPGDPRTIDVDRDPVSERTSERKVVQPSGRR